jgi:hypothetical protein
MHWSDPTIAWIRFGQSRALSHSGSKWRSPPPVASPTSTRSRCRARARRGCRARALRGSVDSWPMDAERRPVCERSQNCLILTSAQDLWWPSALGREQARRQSPVADPPYGRYFVTSQVLGSGPSPAILASTFHLTRGIPVQPSLDIARVGSSRGRSSVKNLTSGENRS